MKKKSNKKYMIIDNSKNLIIKEQLSFLKSYNITSSNMKDVIIYIGDVKKVLQKMPDNIIDCVITSPPYWKQRDYKNPLQIGQEKNFMDYIKNLVDIFTEMKRVLKPTATFFLNVGYKYQDKELLLIPELLANELQKNGWTLLNKIIWHKPNAMPSSLESRFSNVYEPVFLFVKEESKFNYYLSIDKLRIQTNNFYNNRNPEDIIGFRVENSLTKQEKNKGHVLRVFNNLKGDIFAEVLWEDGKISLESVQHFQKESQIPVELICDECGSQIKHEIDIINHNKCKGFFKPILSKLDTDNLIELKPAKLFYAEKKLFNSLNKSYNGKFKLSPENRGASPGARKSLFGEYLVLQRKYKIFQPIIADYLRFWKEKSKITIKKIDEILGYKDTAGHWFRKDTGKWGKGGAIPLPEDWFKLKNILKFDDIYDKWITETHLVLQTVKAHPKGKNPGDVWSIKLQPFTEAHFATFPEELVKKCIECGCPENGVVLDPFAGSGTVGKVALDTNHNAVLIELVPEYLDIIKKRCGNIRRIFYVK